MTRSIVVCVLDWCPACLEYKVVLNGMIGRGEVAASFVLPDDSPVAVEAVPTTIIMRGEQVVGVQTGLITREDLLNLLDCVG